MMDDKTLEIACEKTRELRNPTGIYSVMNELKIILEEKDNNITKKRLDRF